MNAEWLVAAFALALVALIITATVLMMRHREQARKAAHEAKSSNVLSNDTRRACGYSVANNSGTSDNSSSGGGDGGGDGGD